MTTKKFRDTDPIYQEYSRSDRFFYYDQHWYYIIRESELPIGKFESKEMAQKALDRYLKSIDSGAYLGEAISYSVDPWNNR